MTLLFVRWTALAISLPYFLAGLIGCGGDGIVRYPVAGKVTYQGQEVQAGAIIFEPDISVGQIAPTCFARIENGSFQTAHDESPTTGKYKVRVMGYDKSKMRTDAAPGEIIDLPELFPEYSLEANIPVPDGRLDIEVPVSRARGKGK
jgi:hypothetical protein